MKPILFLEPIYENDVFKYITYNFNRHQIIECIGIHKSIYVLCKLKAEEKFCEIIKYYRDCIPKTSILDPTISVQRVTSEYIVITNANPLAYMSLYPQDDYYCKCALFIFTAPSNEVFKKMRRKLNDIHVLFPEFYMFEPDNIEMNFMLNKIFEFKVTDNFDMSSKISTIKVQGTNSFVAGKKGADFSQIYSPTGLYDCFINDDKVNKFICNNGNKNSDMNKFARELPTVKISFGTQNNVITFEPNEQLVYILLSFSCFKQVFHYVLINNSPTLNSHELIIKLKYKLNRRDEGGSNDNPSIIYLVYDSEKDMLTKFIHLYCYDGIFKQLNLSTGPIHWLINNEAQDMIHILDRIFYLKLGYLIISRLSADHLKLNKHALVFNINHKLPYYETGNEIQLYNYLNDVLVVPRPDLKTIVLQCNSNKVQVCTSAGNGDLLNFKYTIADRYRHIGSNKSFYVSTPMELINQAIKEDLKVINNLPIESILQLSNKLNISLSNLANTSNFQKNTLLTFYHFLQSGFFILPCNSPIPSYSLVTPLGSVAADDSSMTTATEFNTSIGGYNFSRDGRIYANSYIVNIDFSSYYPSILATYDISYNNTFIVSGADLLLYMKNIPEFGEYILYSMSLAQNPKIDNTIAPSCIIYEMSENFRVPDNITCIDTALFYLIIIENITDMPSLGTMCVDFIRPATDTAQIVYTKKMINSFCGSLINDKFKYASPQIYRAMVFIGRRIINFVCSNADLIMSKRFTIADACRAYNGNFMTSPSKSIINADTDGFTIQCTNEKQANDLCLSINKIFNTMFRNEKTTNSTSTTTTLSSSVTTGCKRKNYLKCRIKFNTDYLINIRKKKFIHVSNNGTSVAGYNAIKANETQLILQYYTNKIFDFNILKTNKDLTQLLST